MLVLDSTGRVLAATPAARSMFSLASGEPCQPFDVTVEPIRGALPIHINRDSPDGLEFAAAVRGVRREFVLNKATLNDGSGQALGLLFVLSDLTPGDTREFEFEAALRRRVALADEATAAQVKSELLAVISHEIRTPLNVIIGSTSFLTEEPLSPRQREYANDIHSSAQSLLAMLNDILDANAIDAGRVVLNQIDFDLRGVVEDVVEVFVSPAQTRGIQLILDCDPCLDGVYVGDPARLRQVLLNLVGNALKFTEEGAVTIRVRSAAEPESIHFSVSDTGIGIDPAEIPRLFDAFRQADNSMTRRYGGAGLGLTIAKRLVALMRGSIGCESRLGQGSEFSFSVPLRLSGRATTEEPGERCVILSLPNEAVRRLCSVLRRVGYDPVLAESPSAVLKGPPALLILDPGWPELPTRAELHELLEEVRTIKSLKLACLVSGPAERSAAWSQELIPLQEPWLVRRLMPVLAQRHTAPTEEASGRAPYAGRRLLLAEDNPLNRAVAIHMLRRLGCEIDEATSGIEAVAREQTCRYDLILMDLQMPGADGFEATRRIRRREAAHNLSRTPIVAFTAGTFSGERDLAFEAGMDDFLSKPVVKDRLLEVCSHWFDLSASV